MLSKSSARTKKKVPMFRAFLTEFLGMFLFVYCSIAVTAQVLIGDQDQSLPIKKFYGGNGTVALGCGLALALSMALCSGVHYPQLNPAITLALVYFADVKFRSVPAIIAGQIAGAVIASILVTTVHGTKLLSLPDDKGRIAYASYPLLEQANAVTLFWEQLWSSAVFMMVYLSVYGSSKLLSLIVVGGTYSALILATGINAVISANPTRDFFPRLLSYLMGHSLAFDDGPFASYALFLPFIGCCLGGLLHQATIMWFWVEEAPEKDVFGELVNELKEDVEGLKRTIEDNGKTPSDDESEYLWQKLR